MNKSSISAGKNHCGLAALAVTLALSFCRDAFAQCQMCRTALTNSVEGQRWALGINQGILLLLAAPFIIAAWIALAIYWPQLVTIEAKRRTQLRQSFSRKCTSALQMFRA